MSEIQKQDPLKEMLDILKGDYNFPVKLWVYGKIVKEWAGIVIGVTIFLCVFLFSMISISGSGSKVQEENGPPQAVALHIQDIIGFTTIYQRSINKRQEIFENLMKIAQSYVDRKLDQESVERKLSQFSHIFSRCKTEKGIIIEEFTRARDPFEIPGMRAAFARVTENSEAFF